ncbi:hypothetical protein GJ496_002448 [Pomphorhynchus laevis]|nr:hypothetical protein GJ496_002448 [Pomphorhynchus laevis]
MSIFMRDRFLSQYSVNKGWLEYNSLLNISSLPDKLLLKIFSYLPHIQVIQCAYVCRQWRSVAYDSSLWSTVSLRPEHGGLQIKDTTKFIQLFGNRFGECLRDMELPVDLINTEILTELANKCPNLCMLTMDFSNAMQLCDFNDLNVFPCNLRLLCICLSEVIFLEGFMRRIYAYLSSLEVLHIIGTIEKSTDKSEDEIYETLNLHKLKSYTPNLKIINLYGVKFVEDYHIESVASGCIHLECLALNYCTRFKGEPLKLIMNRCRKINSLLLRNTGISNKAFQAVIWENTVLTELDIGSTDLSEECLLDSFKRIPKFKYLAVPYCDGFTDNVLEMLVCHNKLTDTRALDFSYTINLSVETLFNFLKNNAQQLEGIAYTGNPRVTEQFWTGSVPHMQNLRIIIMGTPFGWFRRITTRIHIDTILEVIAQSCVNLQRLEIQWDPDTLRWTDNSSKFADHLRLKCHNLKSFVLTDGEYFELVRSNFERAGRYNIVRSIRLMTRIGEILRASRVSYKYRTGY